MKKPEVAIVAHVFSFQSCLSSDSYEFMAVPHLSWHLNPLGCCVFRNVSFLNRKGTDKFRYDAQKLNLSQPQEEQRPRTRQHKAWINT